MESPWSRPPSIWLNSKLEASEGVPQFGLARPPLAEFQAIVGSGESVNLITCPPVS
jgi:hypothetical protein